LSSFAKKVYDSLIVSERLPETEADTLSNIARARIVEHAARTVPFYSDRLAGVVTP